MGPLAQRWSSLTALLGISPVTFQSPSTTGENILGNVLRRPVHQLSSGLPTLQITEEFKWGNIEPTPHFVFHDCFDGYQCARLEVPMDWNATDASTGDKVALAVIKLPSKVSVTDPRYAGPILINPGGPGGSGVALALGEAQAIQTVASAGYDRDADDHLLSDDSALYYDVLSWDPRGVNNTTPFFTCFSQGSDGVAWQAKEDTTLGTPEGDFLTKWARCQAFGAGCLYDEKTNPNGSKIARYSTTAMVVRDMVEILEQHAEWREQQAKDEISIMQTVLGKSNVDEECILARTRRLAGEEKLQYWGFSYGTILGATFSAMQPHRVHRLVLDGVADAEDYYGHNGGGWTKNLQDTDAVMDTFYEQCFAAGKEACPMYTGKSADDIKTAFDSVKETILKEGPIAVGGNSQRGPDIITASDIDILMFAMLYKPLANFDKLAKIMGPLALDGNASTFADWKHEKHATYKKAPLCDYVDPHKPECNEGSFLEAGTSILCGEGDKDVFNDITQDDFLDYWGMIRNQSMYFGDFWSSIRLRCAGWKGRGAWRWEGPLASNATAHPILWVGNTLDNVTPLRNAIASSKRYKGSVVLQSDVEGHCSSVNPSISLGKHVRAYFQEGKLPEVGTVCLPHRRPFVGTKGPRIDPLPEKLSDDEQDLLAALEDMFQKGTGRHPNGTIQWL